VARDQLDRVRPSTSTGIRPRFDRIDEIDRLLEASGLAKIRAQTVGFGPFTVGRKPVSSEGRGIRLHAALQLLADRGIPPFRATGAHYMVMSRKRPVPGGSE
jgi:hypothetical protein